MQSIALLCRLHLPATAPILNNVTPQLPIPTLMHSLAFSKPQLQQKTLGACLSLHRCEKCLCMQCALCVSHACCSSCVHISLRQSGSIRYRSVWPKNLVLKGCTVSCPPNHAFVLMPFNPPICSFCAFQAAAGMGVFGPRTIYCIALKDAPGCHEFLLQDDGKWVHVKETTEIGQCSHSGFRFQGCMAIEADCKTFPHHMLEVSAALPYRLRWCCISNADYPHAMPSTRCFNWAIVQMLSQRLHRHHCLDHMSLRFVSVIQKKGCSDKQASCLS